MKFKLRSTYILSCGDWVRGNKNRNGICCRSLKVRIYGHLVTVEVNSWLENILKEKLVDAKKGNTKSKGIYFWFVIWWRQELFLWDCYSKNWCLVVSVGSIFKLEFLKFIKFQLCVFKQTFVFSNAEAEMEFVINIAHPPSPCFFGHLGLN